MAKDTNSSANIKELISADPHSIKLALVNLMEKRLGTEADTFEAGFGGYLIQALTLLTSDTLSSLAFSYNEAFTNKCTLRSSANDLGKMFDYTIKNAKPCTGNMTVQIMFPSSTYETYSTKIMNGSLCSNSSIQYMVNGTYEINMNYSACYIKRRDPNTQTVTNVPYTTVSKDGKKYASFNVNVWQVKVFEHTFNFSNVEYQKFYDVNISGFEDYIYDLNVGVYITQENESYSQFIKFKKIENIYSATPMDKVYSLIMGKNNSATIRFGNGVFGYQPEEGQYGKIIIYTTMGSAGAVVSNTLTLNTTLKDIKSNTNLQVSSSNLGNINNGEDEEDIETLKSNIINQISMAKRLVTKDDYKKYNSITGVSSMSLYPILLRRDTNVNEIDLFSVIYGIDGKPVPMNSLSVYSPVPDGDVILLKDHVYRVYYKRGEDPKSLISSNEIPIYPEEGKSYYIDDDYNDLGTDWTGHAGEIATYESSSWSFFDPSEVSDDPGENVTNPLWNKVEYLCPYTISYDSSTSRALYEYIPSKLTLASNLEYLTKYSGVEMNIKNTVINVLPENSMEYSNLNATHFNIVTTIDYNANMNFQNIRMNLNIHNDISDTYSSNNLVPGRRLYFEKEYEMKILSNNEFDNTIQMVANIPITDIPFIKIDKNSTSNPDYTSNPSEYPDENDLNVLVITNKLKYLDNDYNNYSRKVILRDENGKNEISNEYINNELEYTYNPSDVMTMPQTKASISNVEFGINTILFNWSSWKEDSTTKYGYEVIIYMYKLNTVNSSRIKCEFEFGGKTYPPYTRGVGGNGSVLVYKIHIEYKYASSENDPATPIGESTFKIRFSYDFDNSDTYTIFSIYTGSVTARQRLTNTIWSTVVEETLEEYNDRSMYKIYRIPVIEKKYYEENYETLESRILYALSEVDANFNKYKMLTDSVNIKFANTCGLTQNLKYNHRNDDTLDNIFTYDNWVWDTPPTISLKLILNVNNSNRSSTEIIEECKNVVLTFLTIKTTGFSKSILKSDIIRFVHDSIPEVASCEVLSPNRDIIYLIDEYNIPSNNKDELLSYVPDFIWIDKDKISVEVVTIPTI